MPWNRPSLKQLYERIARDFSGRLQEGAGLIVTSVEAVLARIWAGASHLMHGFLAWAFLQIFVDTAEGVYLERWARVWGIYRKDAAAARGQASFPASAGRSIVAGTAGLHQASGSRYIVEETSPEADGAIVVTLNALEPGASFNLSPGTSLQLVSPVPGVNSQGAVAGEGITGGADAESDESLRSRLLDRLRKPPRGGAKHDYEAWAREVAGVTRAWCYPLGMGLGTVSVCFVCDDDPDGPLPSREMVDRVQAHIDTLRPATVHDFEAFAPELFPIVIDVRLTPDTEAVREAAAAELAGLIRREGVPDAVIPISHVREAISIAPGEADHRLLSPTADIVIPAGYFPILQRIIFEEELP